MIRKTVTFLDLDEGLNEIEKEKTVRFLYTLKSISLYEQKTNSNFFEDNEKTFKVFLNAINGADISKSENAEITDTQLLKIAPLMNNPEINRFLINLLPCMYAEIENGKFVQNEETVSVAENSLWLMELVTIKFFVEIFSEISKNQLKNAPKSNSKKNKS